MTTIAVLGATSGIAQACLRAWVTGEVDTLDPVDLRLVARDPARLAEVGDDLATRGARSVERGVHDLATAEGVEQALAWAFAAGPVGLLLIAFGTMPSQADADDDLQVAQSLLALNGTQTALAAHAATLRFLAQGSGQIVVIGSVAGDRGRASNYLYGAAKSMVAATVAGLQHRVHGTGVSLTLVKPGPTATAMTDHLRGGRLKLAPVDEVAAQIVRGAARHAPVVYAPGRWRLIMLVIKALPRALFERTKL